MQGVKMSLEQLALECGVTPIEANELAAKIQKSLQSGSITAKQLNAVADALVVFAEVLR